MQGELLTLAFIFFARICDVSLGTFRIILVARGYKKVAPLLGFFEVLIWLIAIGKAMQNLSHAYSYLIYAAGFATGNYVGMLLEEKIAIGYQAIRIITSKEVSALPLELRREGFGVTEVEGKGLKGPVNILYIVTHKRNIKRAVEVITILEPRSFITIEDVKSYYAGFISNKNIFQQIKGNIAKKK